MVDPTSTTRGGAQRDLLDALFDCLAHSTRRRLLGFALDRAPEPVPRGELETALAAWTSGKSRADVTTDDRRQVAIRLHHVHLPKLTDADLVAVDADDGSIALTDHPAYEDSGVRAVLEGDVDVDAASLDGLFEVIATARCRTILDVLSHQFGRIHIETLARELAVSDTDARPSAVTDEDVDPILSRLSHVDLPRLADAGLVAYDADAETVAYEGHPQLRVPWMHSVFQPAFRQNITGESVPDGIGDIRGREQVISFGQSLCDRADEELFCMFTDTDLLEAGCLTRIRDASKRGVDVYLGTRDEEIREYVRENASDVVLWEPNTDWLNLPTAGDRVGRLLLSDREAVMLGTLLDAQTDGVNEEQAIIGEGEHDTLVTMICQLLGPHLEEIDGDTQDVEAGLPL